MSVRSGLARDWSLEWKAAPVSAEAMFLHEILRPNRVTCNSIWRPEVLVLPPLFVLHNGTSALVGMGMTPRLDIPAP
jgi:hypothetical protein